MQPLKHLLNDALMGGDHLPHVASSTDVLPFLLYFPFNNSMTNVQTWYIETISTPHDGSGGVGIIYQNSSVPELIISKADAFLHTLLLGVLHSLVRAQHCKWMVGQS